MFSATMSSRETENFDEKVELCSEESDEIDEVQPNKRLTSSKNSTSAPSLAFAFIALLIVYNWESANICVRKMNEEWYQSEDLLFCDN